MSLYDIRDNNYLQPNRFFSLRGEVVYLEKEVKYTKIIVRTLNYNNPEDTPDKITVHFRGQTKKIVDGMVMLHHFMLVMGDILTKEGKLYLDGKIIEIYKSSDYVIENNAKTIDPKDINYEPAF